MEVKKNNKNPRKIKEPANLAFVDRKDDKKVYSSYDKMKRIGDKLSMKPIKNSNILRVNCDVKPAMKEEQDEIGMEDPLAVTLYTEEYIKKKMPEIKIKSKIGSVTKEVQKPVKIALLPAEKGASSEAGGLRRRKPDDTSLMSANENSEENSSSSEAKRQKLECPSFQTFIEYEEGDSSSPQDSELQQPLDQQVSGDEESGYVFNYGSEGSSDESDADQMIPPIVPRVYKSTLETPIDTEHDVDINSSTFGETDSATISLSNNENTTQPTYKPWSLCDFDWKALPDTPNTTNSRRENFIASNLGPTTICADPYNIFITIWDLEFMEYIASETNRYARQLSNQRLDKHNLHPCNRIGNWRDTTVDELYVFFGLSIAMGIMVKSKLEEYWNVSSDVFHTPGFSAHMSLNRFKLLNKCLHFCNNDDMCGLDLDGSEAIIFKIQPVLSHLNMKFQCLYNLSRNIILDESLLRWKGTANINELIPDTNTAVDIRTYEISESTTGYLWRFEICAQKKPSIQSSEPLKTSDVSPMPEIVLDLVKGLENKGHTLWMDHTYHSPYLARRLKALGIDCVGTLRTNRKSVPPALHNLTIENMDPDQITGFTSGDVDVMVWRGSNKISMISTYHGNAVAQVQDYTVPRLMLDYNKMMQGLDKRDQMLAMYPMERKRTRVWYKKLFRRLLNISILNSYIIYRKSSSACLTHRNFRIALAKSLFSKHSTHISRHSIPISKHCTPTPLPPVISQNQKVDITHRLAEYPFRNHQRQRRVCLICKKRVQTYCVGCSKTVCIDPCFVIMHS